VQRVVVRAGAGAPPKEAREFVNPQVVAVIPAPGGSAL
jgi:hypothetical protein